MNLKIYNTMTQQKEVFEPIEKNKVKLYVCGPTVYDLLHIGNFRGSVVFNMLRNWLHKSNYQVTYVYNYTDVDDKIIKRANDEGLEASVISERYIKEFQKDYQALELGPHDKNPKVTEYMKEIISMIAKIIENKNAYVVDGEVFYSIDSFEGYGKLSGKNIEDLIAGTRVQVDARKKNPMDFSLWKPAKEGEPYWESPWGKGRPGWHIECSAMNYAIHGEQIDIHGGGIDLIFPHHENEIAQSEAATCGKTFSKYWMHNNFINFSGEKMSKSLGNVKTMRAFLEAYDGEIYKYMILSSHYRSLMDFNDKQIQNAVAALARIYSALNLATKIITNDIKEQEDKAFKEALIKAQNEINEAFNDDINTPLVMAKIFEVIRLFNSSYRLGQKINGQHLFKAKSFLSFVKVNGEILSLFQKEPQVYLKSLDDRLLKEKNVDRVEIDQMVLDRAKARQDKNYELSDQIRKKLDDLGINVSDTPEGSVWEVQKS